MARRLLSPLTALALTLCALVAPRQVQAQVVNGSFEADNCSVTSGYRLGLSGNDMTGWYIPAGDGVYPWCINNASGYGPAADGNQFLVLGYYNTATQYTIQQTLTGLTAGGVYRLDFSIASELNCCATAEVSFLSGSSTLAELFTSSNSGGFWTQWAAKSATFVADNSSVTFQFKDIVSAADGYDLGLDAVSVSEVSVTPEPASIALVATGLLGVAGVARRRRRA